MKHRIHPIRMRVFLTFAVVCNLALGIHSIHSIYRLTRFTTPFSLFLFLLGFAAIFFAAGYKMFVQLTERICITDDELTVYILFRKVNSIRWDEIKEIGVGQIFTPGGSRFCVYFSREQLSYEEIDNLDLASKKCVYLQKLTKNNFDIVSRYCSEEERIILKNWMKR